MLYEVITLPKPVEPIKPKEEKEIPILNIDSLLVEPIQTMEGDSIISDSIPVPKNEYLSNIVTYKAKDFV